jgi:iron complex outermembrane receptor protein
MLAVACQLVCLGAAHAQTKEAEVSNDPVDSKQITITGKKAGQGLLIQEIAPKARSTVTAEELSKQRASGNAYSALELLPAVNTTSDDATGLFGGILTLRGFNSDQIGATINGVPVNDSGNFAIFPQEFVDQENTCSVSVTQGSTDVDSPQVGSSGGNFNIVTCDPSKERKVRISQDVGSLNYSRTFLRFDSGLWNDGKSRIFASVSHKEANKFKGEGRASRDHVDIGFRTDFDKFNSISAAVLYNRAINNNVYKPTLSEIQRFGTNYDYATTFQGHLTPVNGTRQAEANVSGAASFYKLSYNPFENIIASVTAKFRVSENTDIKIIPYYWFGYGTGGIQQRSFEETGAFLNPVTGRNTGSVDLNGDGDTLDRVIVANSSFTRTNRPGVTASVTHYVDNHTILAGVWYERASHEQFGPAVSVDNQGNPFDQFLSQGRIERADGTLFQSRDQKTISTGYQFFAQDTISLLNDQLTVNVGVRAPTLQRDFDNYPNEGRNAGTAYNIKRSYSKLLPQLGARYQLNNNNQLFASLARNFKAPPNTIFQGAAVNGNLVLPPDVKAETSYNLDVGYRLQTDDLTAQLTLYTVDFKNRQANSVDRDTLVSIFTNVGKVKTQGFELEIGNTPKNGWALYGSVGYTDSEFKNDFRPSATVTVPAGNTLPLTPAWKVGTSLGYEAAAWYARIKAKYTSTQQASLTNDQKAPAYTVTGFDAGYQFPDTSWIKKPTIRLNISNLFNETYRSPNSQTAITGANQFYTIGAPRFTSVTFQGDF